MNKRVNLYSAVYCEPDESDWMVCGLRLQGVDEEPASYLAKKDVHEEDIFGIYKDALEKMFRKLKKETQELELEWHLGDLTEKQVKEILNSLEVPEGFFVTVIPKSELGVKMSDAIRDNLQNYVV